MTYLADTHVVLWWLADDPRLSDAHRAILSNGANRVFVSSVSVAEMSLKSSLGKLSIPDELVATVLASGFAELAFTGRHAERLRSLPWHHRDPFDRMLVSQAEEDGLVLLTDDPRCRAYEVQTR